MKTSSLCFYCVLIICFLAQLVNCDVNVNEGVAVKSAAQCLAINVQVRNQDEDILTVTGKENDHVNGIEISLEYSSSTSASALTQQMLSWIRLPFNSLKNITVIAYKFLVDKVPEGFHEWITRPLKKLKDKITESIYCYLKPKIDNPIIIIEPVLEVIWRVVKPVLQVGQWLYEFMAAVIKQAKVKTAEFLKKHPIVLHYSTENCKIVGSHVFSVLAQWLLGWQDSIEYVGFAWVIIYFMFNLIKFSAMDERKLHRTARNQDNIHCSPRKTGNQPKRV